MTYFYNLNQKKSCLNGWNKEKKYRNITIKMAYGVMDSIIFICHYIF